MADSEIQLGQKVQDRVSGFTGIVTTVGEHIAGCTRVGVYPVGEAPAEIRGEEEFFFPQQLVVVEHNSEFREEGDEAITESPFILGQEVEDRVTGFQGVVAVKNFHLWNCPQILIRGSSTSVDEPDSIWVDEPQIEATGSGVIGEFNYVQDSEVEGESGSMEDRSQKELSRPEA